MGFQKDQNYTREDVLKEAGNLTVLPGFCDVHVHFREPGFEYKETIRTGSMASARGGYTAVCTMPNLNPVPDSVEHLKVQLDAIEKDAVIKVLPYGAITVGEKGQVLSDMEGMADQVVAFSDDGKGVQSEDMMRAAMNIAKAKGMVIAAHCEDETYPTTNPLSEWKEIERDIVLAKETGCAFHVCHISTAKSVELIRQAKKEGVDITCETAPHYLVFEEADVLNTGRFKMNPPIRTAADHEALMEGLLDGTIDMIATDHAPHSAAEKGKGFLGSAFGVVGIETAFPVLYTHLVKTGIISLDRLVELLSTNPAKRFGIDLSGDYSIWDLNEEYVIDPEEFLSMGRSTPFDGMKVMGRCKATICGGRVAFEEE